MPVPALQGPRAFDESDVPMSFTLSFAFASSDITLFNGRKFSLSTLVGSASEHSLFYISAAREMVCRHWTDCARTEGQ